MVSVYGCYSSGLGGRFALHGKAGPQTLKTIRDVELAQDSHLDFHTALSYVHLSSSVLLYVHRDRTDY